MPGQTRYIYEFGPFRLDPDERVLTREDEILSLTPKAMDTLLVLIENNRHLVTRDELMSRVWPDIFVEEGNLAQHISMLRKVLGETAEGGQYIETVPKRGYRFAVKVTRIRVEPSETSFMTQHDGESDEVSEPVDTNEGNVETQILTVSGPIIRPPEISPGTRLGRYEVVSRLGVGGMGEVYLANDSQLDRKVALKLLSEQFTGNSLWLKRFLREARTASSLNHPNIITIHEVGKAGTIYFIATEYIEGHTLRRQTAHGRMSIPTAINVAVQVAGALAAAHAAGIVHRDIKPENVMLRPDGYVKVLDFGLAKITDQAENLTIPGLSQVTTDPGIVLGTVKYMSPEQARGIEIDPRSDLFSLGVLMYEMLTGRGPFQGPTSSDVIVSILERDAERLSALVPEVPLELERIVAKSLRKDREQRYQTAKDLQIDLKAVQQELEIRSRLGGAWKIIPDDSGGQAVRIQESADEQVPEVHYARSGEVNIAYQVIGDAPLDLVFVMGWVSHLEYFWSEPSFARFLRRLSTFARVILFDKRGTGLSDSVPLDQLPTLEQRMDDVRAVMDAVGSERAVLCGVSEGGPMCSLFAATYPEKTIALIMIGSYARRLKGDGYPWGPTEEEREQFFDEIRTHWGGPVGLEERAPSMIHDRQFCDWWAAYLRHGASPGAALALTRMNTEIDIRHVLPSVRVPSLIIHRTGDMCLKVEEGRYLARNIPGAKLVELPGVDHLPFVGDQESILDEIEQFLTGARNSPELDRVLATVLIARVEATDVSNDQSARMHKWLDLLDLHHSFVRKEVELFKGKVIEVAGDHLMATFDGPARAIRAACAISDAAARLGVGLKTGLHTGECDVVGDRVGGIAIEIATQMAHQAAQGEVLVSSTVKDLVAGSGLKFTERETCILADDLGEWHVFAVEQS
ncbi:MAG: alpha/beta fold hydrolase [Acidobacteriota bacterium]|nr:MAG: alpha/beta fold hydrolase [Acidobacteriota bacterium]